MGHRDVSFFEYEQKGEDRALKRTFYETEAIVNNWSVRELRRAMDSLLFERTGLSTDKQGVLDEHRSGTGLNPADVIKAPMCWNSWD
ncbi:MAG: YhcG family protein [Saprospirales bacterium]|nr:YhcG family protein [Saprospirales bacterium]